MRAFIKNYLDAEKARREEEGEKGFSLIELIVVVVILGILVAIAVPVFLGLQGQARQAALDTLAANGASQAAAAIAQNGTGPAGDPFTDEDFFANLEAGADDIPGLTISIDGTDLDDFCVTAEATGLDDAESGPNC